MTERLNRQAAVDAAKKCWRFTSGLLLSLWRVVVSISRIRLDDFYPLGAAIWQGLFIAACLVYFRAWSPAPAGIAIGCLAVAAVIISVRADRIKLAEKVVWTVLAFALFGIEIAAIYRDRDTHDQEQATERVRFEKTLADNQSHFNQTLGEMKQLAGLSRQAITLSSNAVQQVTGGGQFCYLQPMISLGTADGKAWFQMAVFNSGPLPLPVCHVDIHDVSQVKNSGFAGVDRALLVMVDQELGPIPPGKPSGGNAGSPYGRSVDIRLPEGSYHILISTRNDQFFEDLTVRAEGDKQAGPKDMVVHDWNGKVIFPEPEKPKPKSQ